MHNNLNISDAELDTTVHETLNVFFSYVGVHSCRLKVATSMVNTITASRRYRSDLFRLLCIPSLVPPKRRESDLDFPIPRSRSFPTLLACRSNLG